MTHLLFFSILLSSCFADSSKEVTLFDSAKTQVDLNWPTLSTYRDAAYDPVGWYEESWPGPDGTSNYRIYASCNTESSSRNDNGSNWVFTPIIDVTKVPVPLTSVMVRVLYTIRDCSKTGAHCKETVNMHAKQYSTTEPNFDPERDFNVNSKSFAENWKRERVLTLSTLDEVQNITTVIDLRKKTKSIQLTFDDNGSCSSLLMIKVFYTTCDNRREHLINFPQTVAQSGNPQENVLVTGSCVDNAAPKNGVPPIAFCGKTGSWTENIIGSCECLPGFTSNNNACSPCARGAYKSEPGPQECVLCPQHSDAVAFGSAHCTCLPGFFRAPNDSIATACTQPPGRPTDVTVKFVNQSTVLLQWNEPSTLGGRNEIWYEWQCARGDCSSVRAQPADKRIVSRMIHLSGLKSDMDYSFNIFARNKVSAIAGEAAASYRAVDIRTAPQTQNEITRLRVESETKDGIYLAWDFKRISSEYEIEVLAPEYGIQKTYSSSSPSIFIGDIRTNALYIFKVRAHTDSWTSWSNPLSYQSGSGLTVLVGTSSGIEPETTALEAFPIWVLLLITVLVILLLGFILLLCRRGSKNRKQMSDLDVLDTYKQDTMTPDYGSGHRQFNEPFRATKINAPLIPSYGSGSPGSHPPPYYGGNSTLKFKPYVDPTAYEDPNQALMEFAFDIPPQNVFITQVIGGGEFGDVCMGGYTKDINNPNEVEAVAIKTLKRGSTPKSKADFLLEASIMGQFHHPNVIRLIGVVTQSDTAMIVTEYMENGSLDFFLKGRDARGEELGWSRVVEMLRGISSGMKYLTDKGYVHRDLAARNVLVDSQLSCKIADFGLSREVDDSTEAQYTTNGGKIPVRWTAPEAITHRKFTASSDVWSFGVLMWEVCSFGERPYWEWTNQKVISEIMNGYRLPPPMNCPTSLHRLMLWCWKLDRHDRPSFAQLLEVLEKYCRNPDYIYLDNTYAGPHRSSFSVNTGTLTRSVVDICPPPPPGSPPIYPQLDDFLRSLGIGHTLDKLNGAGIRTVGDLARRRHLDLLAIGLITEEWNRIRDALAQLKTPRSRPLVPQRDEGFFV